MATTKLLYGRIVGIESGTIPELLDLIRTHGLSAENEYGAIHAKTIGADVLTFTFVRQADQKYMRVPAADTAPELEETQITKATTVDVVIRADKERIVLTGGSPALLEHVGVFLAGLGLAIVVETIDTSILTAVNAICEKRVDDRIQIRSAEATTVPLKTWVGKFSTTFKDSGEGREFIEDMTEGLTKVGMRFMGSEAWVKISIGQKSAFSVSVGKEDDPRAALEMLRDIVYGG